MRFERSEQVRLVRQESGVPSGTEGMVMGFDRKAQTYWVQFPEYGAHQVPEESIEKIDD